MKREPVASSALRSVGYDPREKVLEIEFTDDTIYQFFPVPADVVRELLSAKSKGTFFDERIRTRFIHRQVDSSEH